MPDLAQTLTEALYHLTKPTASSLLGELGVKPPAKGTLPPEIEAAVRSFVESESRLYLNPSLLSSAKIKEEPHEDLVETAVNAFAVSWARGRWPKSPRKLTPSLLQEAIQLPLRYSRPETPLSFVSHDREMLRFNRKYRGKPAPLCCRGERCAVNRVKYCPPSSCLGVGTALPECSHTLLGSYPFP